MPEDYIQMLISSIEHFDESDVVPYFILLYLDSGNEEDERFYFAVLSAMKYPSKEEMDELFYQTKNKAGNMIFAAEYLIMNKFDAIDHLENLLY